MASIGISAWGRASRCWGSCWRWHCWGWSASTWWSHRIDHRRATAASFGLQALGMALMGLGDLPLLVIAGCCLVGVSVGNVITLPALFAQREFAPQHYAKVVTRIWSVGQVMYAFGPIGAGLLLGATGSSGATLLACMACQLVAMALCAARPGGH